jgi:hypothetical protein
MPWGKFRGCSLDEIETSYLVWCLEKADNLRVGLRADIQAELGRRFGPPPPPPPSSSWRRTCPDPALAAQVVATGLRTLARKHHPDVGGDTAVMQRLAATADWLKAQVPQ